MDNKNLIYNKDGFVIDCKNLNEFDRDTWVDISMFQKLSEEFIEKFKDNILWFGISKYQRLSEKFIKKFKDKVYYPYITLHQKLSDEFIEKHKDKVDWGLISEYKKECKVSLCISCGFVMLENILCQNCHDENLKTLKMTYKEFQELPDFPSKEDLVEFLL